MMIVARVAGTQPITIKLNSGVVVLAKTDRYGTHAMTFANRTQALNAAARFGGWVCQMGRPFFVRFEQEVS